MDSNSSLITCDKTKMAEEFSQPFWFLVSILKYYNYFFFVSIKMYFLNTYFQGMKSIGMIIPENIYAIPSAGEPLSVPADHKG